MVQINKEFFLEERAKKSILEQVSRYCSSCYKEFEIEEVIYYDIKECHYLCKECAKKRTLLVSEEIFEIDDGPTLFG